MQLLLPSGSVLWFDRASMTWTHSKGIPVAAIKISKSRTTHHIPSTNLDYVALHFFVNRKFQILDAKVDTLDLFLKHISQESSEIKQFYLGLLKQVNLEQASYTHLSVEKMVDSMKRAIEN